MKGLEPGPITKKKACVHKPKSHILLEESLHNDPVY
jgi:hypothetical protein